MAKISRTKIRAIFYFWPVFAQKTAFLADFCDNWGHFYTFLPTKMDENWHTSSTLKADKEKKNSSVTPHAFLGQKWPIFALKTAFLADFEIIGGISLSFII